LRGGRLALWGRGYSMTLENVAHRLVTDGVPEIGQGADDPVIAPGTVLVRYTHHQGLQLWVDRGPARSLALLGSIKLLRHAFAVPAEHRVRLDDGGHFSQRFFS